MSLLSNIAVLSPKGTIALAERGLMIHAIEFMLIVAVPVLTLLFFFAWRYNANNTKAKARYMPDWAHSNMDELVWWAIPIEIILILGALTWTSTHQLDPHKPIDSNLQPLVVEVVALDWKWLFIYPEQHIASVNYLHIPVGRPVQFHITADAPMNSFWIPQLGGQIYAMTGMVTTLNLIATEVGKYSGVSANYSGEGFSHMKFVADVSSQEDFDAWVEAQQESVNTLNAEQYAVLAKPSVEDTPIYYGGVDQNLFDTIVMKFMDNSSSRLHER